MDAADGEVWYLELELNWYFLEIVASFVLNRWETELSAHQELFTSRELLDDPNHAALIWYVFDCTHVGLEHWRVNVDRHWYDDLDIVRN